MSDRKEFEDEVSSAWRKELQNLALKQYDRIKSLESELKEYKRCAVLGGDGKPIKVGDTFYFKSKVTWDASSSVVKRIEQTSKGAMVRDSYGGSSHHVSDCFSTPDAVPGGDT